MYIDLIIQLKNAAAAKKETVRMKYTKTDGAILEELRRFGFVKKFEVKGRSFKKIVEIDVNLERPITGVKFLSTPSLRRYTGYEKLRSVKSGYGLLIVSTSSGIMAGHEARKRKVGGQLLFEIW